MGPQHTLFSVEAGHGAFTFTIETGGVYLKLGRREWFWSREDRRLVRD